MATKKIDLTKERRTNSLYNVIIECACSVTEYLDDESETIIYNVIAENPAQALQKTMYNLLYSESSIWNERDILRVDIQLSLDEIRDRKQKENKLLKK